MLTNRPQLNPIVKDTFPDRQSKIDEGLCSGFNCDNTTTRESFSSEQALKIFNMTGLCANCQNQMFDSVLPFNR